MTDDTDGCDICHRNIKQWHGSWCDQQTTARSQIKRMLTLNTSMDLFYYSSCSPLFHRC